MRFNMLKYKVMMGFLIIAISGCNDKVESYNSIVKCNEEQLLMVEKQFNLCSKSGYIDSYCYDQARFEQCDVIDVQLKENTNE